MLYKNLGGKRRILTAALLSTLLITALADVLFFNLAEAGVPILPDSIIVVTIQLPENKVYTENSIPVAFTIQRSYARWYMTGQPDSYAYLLDSKEIVFRPSKVSADSDYYVCEATLSGLSEGTHWLFILVHYNYLLGRTGRGEIAHAGFSDVVAFKVNAAAPRVSVLSPKPARTYNTTTLPLEFTVSEPASWVGYGLDGEAPVTITGNTTLYDLSNGTHTIVVHAEDTTGSTGASTPITFKVKTQDTQPGPQPSEPFPTWIVATTVIGLIAVVGAALLVYFGKIRKTTKKAE